MANPPPAETSLQLEVYNTGYKPIPSAVPGWPEGWQATFPATTATLVFGDRDAILVDSLITRDESKQLAQWLLASGKNVTPIYITHGHARSLLRAEHGARDVPEAKAVALAEIVPFVAEQTTPEWMQIWEGIFPGQLFAKPAVPVALEAPEMTVEGHTLLPIKFGQSDVSDSSAVHIPELDTLIAGDIIYNNIHVWMFRSTTTTGWRGSRRSTRSRALRPKTIIAGHSDPHAPDNDGPRLLSQTREYIHDFDEAVTAGGSGEAVVSTMTEKYPEHGNPYTLWLAAYTQPYGEQS